VAFIQLHHFLLRFYSLASGLPEKSGPSSWWPWVLSSLLASEHTYTVLFFVQKMSTSVHAAAQNNQLSLLRSLVSEDATSVNAVDADSRTPLHWAASGGHLDVVAYLLANGAEVDKTDDNGWTPLHIAGRC
jgi:hypothetical protein